MSRPFTVAPLFLLLFWLVTLRLPDLGKGIGFLAAILVVSLLWHPVVAVIEGLLLGAFLTIRYARNIGFVDRSLKVAAYRLRPHVLVPFFAVLVVFYLLWTTQTGPATVGRLAIALLGEGGGGASGASVDEGASLLTQIPSALFEFARRMAFVLVLSATAVVALIYEWSSGRLSRPVVVSFVGVVFLGGSFIFLDIGVGVAFGPRRFVSLMPLVLLPAVIKGFSHVPNSHLQVIVAILLVSSGLAIVYSSPFTGSIARSVTQEDAQGVEWLHHHRTDGAVVGSQSTYWIVEGRFGERTVDDWAEGSRFSYQWGRRPYQRAWDIPQRVEWKYAAVSYPARRKAQDNPTERRELEGFNRQNSRIYDSGNLWWIAD